MGNRLTVYGSQAMIDEKVNSPQPKEYEKKSVFCARFITHPIVTKSYSTLVKRHLAAERRWAKAKSESMISVTTGEGEVLLF